VLRFLSLTALACFAASGAFATDQPANDAAAQRPIVLAQADSKEAQKEAFESAKDLGTVEAWDAFLSNYPDGFYADLARAYVKKLAEPDATDDEPEVSEPAPSPAPAPAAPPMQTVHNGPGSSDWYNTTKPFVANSRRPAYAAVVDAGGIELTAFCHGSGSNLRIIPGLRATDSGVAARLREGLAAAPSITNELAGVSMTFSDGTEIGGVAATTPPQNDEVTLYVDRKLPEPDGRVIEKLMAGQEVTITAEPFMASFQLDGSRSALCSMMNKCGGKVSGCGGGASSTPDCGRGQYRDRKGRCVDDDDDDGQDGRINCGRGRTWVGAQGRCVCVDSNRHWNGSRCVRRKGKKPKGCTGGRTWDAQTRSCMCNGDSAWNGRACVKENDPNDNNAQMKKAVCGTLQIACSLGNQGACNKFNNGCR
jgi:hypothetical protein